MKLNFKLIAGLVPVFFMLATPVFAQDPAQCVAETKEEVLKKGIADQPDLLMAELEDEALESFWNKMREKKFLMGSIGINKVYVFYSENHPDLVYVFFLRDGCIVDVKFTFKKLIEEFIQ